jgi:hypothetical protein
MNSLKIVTVATKSNYYLPYLKESVERHGSELIILGYGEEWSGFNLKYSLIIEYLKTLNRKDIVCFIDGYDVICCRNLNEITNIFLKIKEKHGCKIIVGEDKMDMGNVMNQVARNFIYLFFGGMCKKKFLNSGTYIGYVEDILDITNNIYKLTNSNTSDDQIQMKKYCREHPNDFYIDINSEMFLTINKPYYDIDHLVKIDENNHLYYKNSKPFFIHAPAGTFLDNILSKLGYTTDIQIREQIKNDFYKKYSMYLSPTFYSNYIENNNKYLILFIILLVIIIFLIYFLYKNKKYYQKIMKKIIK